MAERRLDHDRLTALQATPSNARPAFEALWNVDLAFADIVATTTDPALGAIRMAWWRERLEELDRSAAAPAEPRLQAVKRDLIGPNVTGLELSQLEDSWLPMLEPFPWGERIADGFRARGRLLFRIGARLLDGDAVEVEAAGALWSLVDGVMHCSDTSSRAMLRGEARDAIRDMPPRLPAVVRPLTVLAALAAYDLRSGGRLGRVGVAFAHRWRGTIPHS